MAKTANCSTKKCGEQRKKVVKKWELKPIPEKKEKKPQKMMQQYYPVVKSKKPEPEVNFQGFPLSECQYAKEIGTYVYCPPASVYGGCAPPRKKGWKVCSDCYLKPCIADEKYNKIMEFCTDFRTYADDEELDEAYEKIMDRIEDMLTNIFGRKYASTIRVPDCVEEMVMDSYNFKRDYRDSFPAHLESIYSFEGFQEMSRDSSIYRYNEEW